MGRIPLFERQRLASSVVGTPGEVTIGRDISTTFGALAVESRKAENAKRALVDKTETKLNLTRFQNQVQSHLRQAEQDYVDDPYKVPENFNQQAGIMLNEMAQGISNERVRSSVINAGRTYIEREQGRVDKRASNQASTNAFANAEETKNQLSNMFASAQNIEELAVAQNSVVDATETWTQAFGETKATEFAKSANKEGMLNYLYANAEKSPETMQQYIDQGIFDSTLDEKEKFQTKNTLDGIIKKRGIEIKRQTQSDDSIALNDMFNQSLMGALTIKDIDRALASAKDDPNRTGYVKVLLSLKEDYMESDTTSPNKLSSEQLFEARSNIMTRYKNLFLDEPKRRVDPISEDADYQELQGFKASVIQAYTNKALTKDEARAYMDSISAGEQELIKPAMKTEGFFRKSTRPIDEFNRGKKLLHDFANKNISDPVARNNFLLDCFSNYMTDYESLQGSKDKNGNPFTVDGFVGFLKKVKGPKYGLKLEDIK